MALRGRTPLGRCGGAPGPRRGVTPPRAGAIDEVGGSAVLVGHSSGCSIALAASSRLLVIGSHGRGAFLRLLLGSVSHSLALSVPGPLVVLRHPERAR